MVDHGIESEDERIEKTKSQKGNILIHFEHMKNSFSIQLKDDGQGIFPDKLSKKAIEIGLKTSKEIETLEESKIIEMIFLPGLSTKEEVSGRGIGMNAVKMGGKISVSSKIDDGTTFTIILPILG
jgi:two-component system chemotaxis sensor kinase CheA